MRRKYTNLCHVMFADGVSIAVQSADQLPPWSYAISDNVWSQLRSHFVPTSSEYSGLTASPEMEAVESDAFGRTPSSKQNVTEAAIPAEILIIIFQFLAPSDLLNVRLTSSRWSGIASRFCNKDDEQVEESQLKRNPRGHSALINSIVVNIEYRTRLSNIDLVTLRRSLFQYTNLRALFVSLPWRTNARLSRWESKLMSREPEQPTLCAFSNLFSTNLTLYKVMDFHISAVTVSAPIFSIFLIRGLPNLERLRLNLISLSYGTWEGVFESLKRRAKLHAFTIMGGTNEYLPRLWHQNGILFGEPENLSLIRLPGSTINDKQPLIIEESTSMEERRNLAINNTLNRWQRYVLWGGQRPDWETYEIRSRRPGFVEEADRWFCWEVARGARKVEGWKEG